MSKIISSTCSKYYIIATITYKRIGCRNAGVDTGNTCIINIIDYTLVKQDFRVIIVMKEVVLQLPGKRF